jgi:hypothetical protein
MASASNGKEKTPSKDDRQDSKLKEEVEMKPRKKK